MVLIGFYDCHKRVLVLDLIYKLYNIVYIRNHINFTLYFDQMVVLRFKEWLTSRLWFKLVFVIAINVFYILDLIYKLYYRPYLTFQPHGGFYGLTGG